MISSLSTLERGALDELERRLSDQGYTVVREPRGADLPAFLGSFQPDAVATGKLPSLLVEVITQRGSAQADAKKIEQLRSLLSSHPDWKLEVVYAAPSSPLPNVAPIAAIRDRYEEVRRLSATDRPAAMIMAWSLLEAVTRAMLPDRAARGLTPASTIELLTSLGYIAQSEADTLRDAGRARNLIVHGDVTANVLPVELEKVFDIIYALIRHQERHQSGAA